MASPERRRGQRRSKGRSSGLDQPIDTTRGIRPTYDSERFGRLSERVARYIGSWAFIAWMTLVIIAWVSFNIFAPEGIKPDAYPFIFLTLLLSLQASYAAPLILLAQNRQTDRDRVQYQEDRSRNERMLADSDYLAREVAALRSSLGELATRDYVRSELRETLDQIMDRLDRLEGSNLEGSNLKKTRLGNNGDGEVADWGESPS